MNEKTSLLTKKIYGGIGLGIAILIAVVVIGHFMSIPSSQVAKFTTANLQYPTFANSLKTGDSANIVVNVENFSNHTIYNVYVELKPQKQDSGQYLVMPEKTEIAKQIGMNGGDSGQRLIPVKIIGEPYEGTINIELKLYASNNEDGSDSQYQTSTDVPISIK